MTELLINYSDPDIKPATRSFVSRAQAQIAVNELYMNRHISAEEWCRLFDRLSENSKLEAHLRITAGNAEEKARKLVKVD